MSKFAPYFKAFAGDANPALDEIVLGIPKRQEQKWFNTVAHNHKYGRQTLYPQFPILLKST